MKSYYQLTNQELLKKCQEIGKKIQLNRKLFADLLPEVYKRQIYRKKFSTIYEFAAKLAGMTKNTVDEILYVARKLADKPALREIMPQAGWAKLRVVSTIATKENQNELAELTMKLPKAALEQYKRDHFLQTDEDDHPVQTEYKTIKLHEGTALKFKIKKQQLEKKLGKKLTDEMFVNELLKGNCPKEIKLRKATKSTRVETLSRHIPAATKRTVLEEAHNLCAHKNCRKLATDLHHLRPFAISQTHANNLQPLCKEHHQLTHLLGKGAINKKYQQKFWNLC